MQRPPLDVCTAREPDGRPILSSEDGEALVSTAPSVSLFVGEDRAGECGSLYVTNRRVVWFSDARPASGHSIPFRSIGVHGVCRDTSAFPHACIFAQAEVVRGEPPEADGEDAIEEDGEDEDNISEVADETVDLRFVPPNPQDVDELYRIFCECALQNPDPGGDSDDGEGDFYCNEDEVLAGAGAAGAAALAHFDELLQIDSDRFADDDGDEDEGEWEEGEEEEEAAAGQANGGPK